MASIAATKIDKMKEQIMKVVWVWAWEVKNKCLILCKLGYKRIDLGTQEGKSLVK